ncbi:MAG: hypothetical protein ACRDZO_22795 [Egibacteraceae bacterium]
MTQLLIKARGGGTGCAHYATSASRPQEIGTVLERSVDELTTWRDLLATNPAELPMPDPANS